MAIEILLALGMALLTLVGVLIIILGLPGAWLIVAGGLLAQLIDPNPYSWWTLGVAAAIALLGEVIEFGAGAVGAGASGASQKAAWAAVAGAILGAILGTIFLPVPVAGTLVGSAVGAGLAAGLVELNREDRPGLGHASRVFRGAAVGRLLAVIGKGACALAAGGILVVAALAQ